MEEKLTNLTQDDVLELIKDFPVIPLRGKVIITMNTEDVDENGLLLSSANFSEVQYIVAAPEGDVCQVQAGQKVILDLEAMMTFTSSDTDAYEKVGHVKLKPIQVEDKIYGLINERYIDAKDFRKV